MVRERKDGDCNQEQIERDQKQADQKSQPPAETTNKKSTLQPLKPLSQIAESWLFMPCRWFVRHSYASVIVARPGERPAGLEARGG
jgi:hypothetical protein